MPREINSAKYSDLLRKLTELQGALRIDLLEELRPVLVLENDRPEWFFLRKERIASGTASTTSGAGTLAECGIFNPPTSGLVVVVTGMQVMTSASVDIFRRYVTALPALAAVNNAGVRDTRVRPGGPFVSTTIVGAQVYQAVPAVVDGGIADKEFVLVINSAPVETIGPRGEIVLAPGTGVQLSDAAVGVSTLRVNFDWYEKPIGAEA